MYSGRGLLLCLFSVPFFSILNVLFTFLMDLEHDIEILMELSTVTQRFFFSCVLIANLEPTSVMHASEWFYPCAVLCIYQHLICHFFAQSLGIVSHLQLLTVEFHFIALNNRVSSENFITSFFQMTNEHVG